MRAFSTAMTHACGVTHVRSTRPTSVAPKPVAIGGARVARVGTDLVEQRTQRSLLAQAFVAPESTHGPTTFSAVRDDDADTLVEAGCHVFDRAFERASRLERDEPDPASREQLDSLLAAIEQTARVALNERIDAAIARARRALEDTREFALDMIDEAPEARRSAMAKSARSAIEATLNESQPTLVIAPRALIVARYVARVARWRLSSDAGWAWLETESRSDGERVHARCPQCESRSARWSLCDHCVEARCGRCARRCARCRHTGCVRCAMTTRCASCGLSAMERIDES